MGTPWKYEAADAPVDVGRQLEREAQALHRAAGEGASHRLYLWNGLPSLVVTKRHERLPNFAAAAAAFAVQGIAIHVRATGGDVCPQDPGILNVSAIYSSAVNGRLSIDDAYRWFCGRLQQAFAALGVTTTPGGVAGAFCDGRFNLLARHRKLAGTSQRWRLVGDGKRRRLSVLAHGLILLDADRAAVTARVEKFYSLAGEPCTLSPDALINLSEVLPRRDLLIALQESLLRAFSEQ